MHRILFGALALALLPTLGHAQDKLKTDGFGSVTGTVTLKGAVPAIVDLTPKMKIHADKTCCLEGKANETIDTTWIVNPKTKAVANVVVWVKAPMGTYFPTHQKYKNRKETVVIDQPHCAFLPRIAAFNPVQYDDNGKLVESGMDVLIKNSAVVPHNVRAIGHPKSTDGFNRNLPPKTELSVTKDLKDRQRLLPQNLPVSLQCDVHTWMAGKLFVFDHPYYAITKEDGSFEIPNVPAGAQITLMAWHEGVGWVLTNKGETITVEKGKSLKKDFTVTAPPPGQ